MVIESTLLVLLGAAIGKFLLKDYLGGFSEAVGGGLIDYAKEKIKDALTRKKAEREFERIGEQIVERLVKDFGSIPSGPSAPDINKVVQRLTDCFAGNLTAKFVVRNQIDPTMLAAALKAADSQRGVPLSEAEQELFDRGLLEASRYLARTVAKLPAFQEAQAAYSIEVLQTVAREVEEVLDDTRAIREVVVKRANKDEQDYEINYRNALVAKLDRVELFGADLPPELQEARLTDAYVTLRLRNSADTDDEDDEAAEEDEACELGRLTTEEAFARLKPGQGRLLIRGGAGCGKTTLVRWAAIQAARMTSPEHRSRPVFERDPSGDIRLLHDDEQAAREADWRSRMPFVIVLRNCLDGKLPSPEKFPAEVAQEAGNPPEQWVQRILRDGKALILIDGIDEVSQLHHAILYKSIQALIEAFPNNYFILTTRPDAVRGVQFENLQFAGAEVEPLTDTDRRDFITHWFKAVAKKQNLNDTETTKALDEAKALETDLATTPWLTPLVSNPLFCEMTCALYRARRGFLPNGLRQMCETLCEVTIHRRDLERHLDLSRFPEPYPRLSYEQKKLILRRLGYYFVLNGYSAIPWPDAEEQVGKALAGMPDRQASEATPVLETMITRSGLLRYATPEIVNRPATIEFTHNTFKEFLAGEQLADEGNVKFLIDHLHQETWRRVGLFAVAAGSKKFQNDVLRTFLNKIPDPLPRVRKLKDPSDEAVANTPRGKAVYAIRCRPLANQCDDDVKERLNKLTSQLLPPRNPTDATWLAAAGNSIVPYLQWKQGKMSIACTRACVRTLLLIDTPEAKEVLREYGNDDRQGVLVELIEALEFESMPALIAQIAYSGKIPSFARKSIVTLKPVSFLPSLTTLDLSSTSVVDLTPLKGLTALTSLDLRFTPVMDLTPLKGLTALTSLNLANTLVANLTPLKELTALTSVDLSSAPVTDLTPLKGLTALTSLHLYETRVADLSPLKELTALTSLNLNRAPVTDLTPLKGLTALTSLNLANTLVANLTPLKELTALTSLNVANALVKDADIALFKQNLPNCSIVSRYY